MIEKTDEILDLLLDESFQRWLSGQATEEEEQDWNKWLQESPSNPRKLAEARRVWRAAKFRTTSEPEVGREWTNLACRLNLNAASSETAVEQPSRAEWAYPQRQRRESWMRFATVAFAVAVLAFIFIRVLSPWRSGGPNSAQLQAISTDYGQRATINLPDETTIILNANSTLRYPAVWKPGTSHRFELSGEAYFDVENLKRHPGEAFVIFTHDGTVRVTGTRFVVYDRGEGTRVVVAEGSVAVKSAPAQSTEQVHEVDVKPGRLLHFKRGSSELTPRQVAIEPYITWWQKQFVLQRTPFKEIVQRLEETYGVRVKVMDERLLRRTLSGTIENQSIVTVTDALATALKVPVTREGQVIIFGRSPFRKH